MSAWGHMARLGDARLTRDAMDRTAHGFDVARLMFFGASPDNPPEPPPVAQAPRTVLRRAAGRSGRGGRRG